MVDESLYLTTHEAALAVVATAMKKARQLFLTLCINSLMGGIFFTSGGMLYVMLQAELPGTLAVDPGYLFLLQGLVYPIGLFYVVLMGVDIYNLNILFFTVGLARGAVSFLDLFISLFVSWWLNLVGNIFVCYVICHYSGVTSTSNWVTGSVFILEKKLNLTFAESLIKGIAGNFFVCLAIYLQLMAKPIHVKLVAMALPVFTFVSLGFSHSVADMFMIVIGLINGAPVSVGTCAWKLFLPGALGNLIGGTFFGLVIPFYLHLIVVEQDQKELNLPRYEMRDEQPELNQDSRVIRAPTHEDELDNIDEFLKDEPEKLHQISHDYAALSLVGSIASNKSGASIRSRIRKQKSPGNVFPVYGMGGMGARERAVAYGRGTDEVDLALTGAHERNASFMSSRICRTISRRCENTDLEAQDPIADTMSVKSINMGSISRKFSCRSMGRARRLNAVDPSIRSLVDPLNQGCYDKSGVSVLETLLSSLSVSAKRDETVNVRPYEPDEIRD